VSLPPAHRRGTQDTPSALLASALLLSIASPAHADWRTVREVTLGTAQVLEPGSLTVGLSSPLVFGLTRDLTVQTHPLLDLLLSVNVGARYRFVERTRFVVSATGLYLRSIYRTKNDTSDRPGQAQVGGQVTWYAADAVALTGILGSAWRFGENQELGGTASLQLHVLGTQRDLFAATGYARWRVDETVPATAALDLLWVRAWTFWKRVHTQVGLTVGDRADVLGAPLWDASTWPVRPYLDLWWRF
jgi:hypothetical protein